MEVEEVQSTIVLVDRPTVVAPPQVEGPHLVSLVLAARARAANREAEAGAGVCGAGVAPGEERCGWSGAVHWIVEV